MKINISEDAMGFRLKLGGSKDEFETLLANLKAGIAANCRKFTAGHWFIHRRAAGDVEYFIKSMQTHYGATVERGGVEREPVEYPKVFEPSPLIQPVPDDKPVSKGVIESLLRLARMNSYLTISDGQEQASLLWSAECRRESKPYIVLAKMPRWFSFNAHLFGEVLTDEAKNQAFEILLTSSLPGGSVRASNRTLTASRLPFGVGVQITQSLTALLFDERNRERDAGREHARWEARKMADGEIKYSQRGADRRDKEAA